MATIQERELILREIGSVFGDFQKVLNTLHGDYWNETKESSNSLLVPSMEEILGTKFSDFATIYSGFHAYLTIIKRVLETKGDKLDFAQAISNVKAMCIKWSDDLNKWKQKYP